MNILVIAEKKKIAKPFVEAIREKGANAKYVRVSKIILVSRQKETLIKSLDNEVLGYDAVFLQARASLAPFIEPLLEELKNQGVYSSAHRGSYYTALNEPFQFVTLALAGVPTPKTLMSGSAKNIEKVSKKISYPLIAKYFVGKNVQQAIVVETVKELNSFIKSVRTETDGFMLREYIEGDAVSCAVIGDKVFSVKRKSKEGTVSELAAGETYHPSEEEQRTAISAAKACGFGIAKVDLAKGKVVKVEPMVNWEAFDKISSENLEEQVASFLIEKAKTHEHKRKPSRDLMGLGKLLQKTPFSGWFK